MAPLTFRVSFLPSSFEEARLPELFSRLDRALIIHTSLALGIDGSTQTATVTFKSEPSLLSQLTEGVYCTEIQENQIQATIQIDTTFRGLTPLHSPSNDNAVVFVSQRPLGL
jgi:hypothetical protein